MQIGSPHKDYELQVDPVKCFYFSGAMVTPILNSYLMEERYDSFVTTTMICQLLCSLSFLLIWFVGSELKVKTQTALTEKALLS